MIGKALAIAGWWFVVAFVAIGVLVVLGGARLWWHRRAR